MPNTKPSLLIVDDDHAVRISLACALKEIGYSVRTAGGGFAALAEIGEEAPEILISDLNMPGMSGFELLKVTRRRFPGVQTIAMSGAFSGDEVPSGVAADAFYQKGSSIGSLLRIMENLPFDERMHARHPTEKPPGWILSDVYAASGEVRVTVSCPVCMRTFPNTMMEPTGQTWQGVCMHCQSAIRVTKVPSADPGIEALARARQASVSPTLQRQQTIDCE